MSIIIGFIIVSILVWGLGCFIINEYEFFYEFADKFSYPINMVIKIVLNLPYVGFIVGGLTICIMLFVCCVGIVILYPIKCFGDVLQ